MAVNRNRWPLLLIAAPAAISIWSGWVGLGGLAGFGMVAPLPGITGWHLDTAITLPVGIEAYGAYALGAWLASPDVKGPARTFARRSAIGALLLGMCGQVVFHLLAAAHAVRAPWPVVVLVSCVPVVTLGFAAALTHLLRSAPASELRDEPAQVSEAASEVQVRSRAAQPEPAPEAPAAAPLPEAPTRTRTRTPKRTAPKLARDPLTEFAAEVAAGELPSQRQVQGRMHVGWEKAGRIRADLEQAISERVPVTPNGNGAHG